MKARKVRLALALNEEEQEWTTLCIGWVTTSSMTGSNCLTWYLTNCKLLDKSNIFWLDTSTPQLIAILLSLEKKDISSERKLPESLTQRSWFQLGSSSLTKKTTRSLTMMKNLQLNKQANWILLINGFIITPTSSRLTEFSTSFQTQSLKTNEKNSKESSLRTMLFLDVLQLRVKMLL